MAEPLGNFGFLIASTLILAPDFQFGPVVPSSAENVDHSTASSPQKPGNRHPSRIIDRSGDRLEDILGHVLRDLMIATKAQDIAVNLCAMRTVENRESLAHFLR
jgi:hypothetical protein